MLTVNMLTGGEFEGTKKKHAKNTVMKLVTCWPLTVLNLLAGGTWGRGGGASPSPPARKKCAADLRFLPCRCVVKSCRFGDQKYSVSPQLQPCFFQRLSRGVEVLPLYLLLLLLNLI